MNLIDGIFRALDWFTPSAMKSRIDIFKDAANEVGYNCRSLKRILIELRNVFSGLRRARVQVKILL